ncbi:MAG: hypothetical protein NDI62_01550 [Burkholderiales bacterium]|nr:hypothetical protein [Burkholderiales bacterium]
MEEKLLVPDPPQVTIVVEEKAKENLQKWISFIKNLSPRILIEDNISRERLYSLYNASRKLCHLDEDDQIVDWPELQDVAFVVFINSSHTKSDNYLLPDIYIFCYRNWAFSLDHFQRDSNDEKDEYVDYNTYSLKDFPEEALSWEHVSGTLIVSDLERIEKTVPDLKTKS